MPAAALNFVFVMLVGISSLFHSQDSRTPAQRDGVYLVPMSVPPERSAGLQRYYHEVLHLDVQVLPPFSPSLAAWSADRRQWSAEAVAGELIEREEDRLRSGRVVVIAITDDDIASKRDGWVFGWWTAARVGIVSSARMDPRWNRQDADENLLRTRLRRMVTKYIGRSYLDMALTSDPTSPLYDRISSVSALDAMSDDLVAAGFLSGRPLIDAVIPVSLSTGIYVHRDVDFALEDTPRVALERTYRSNDRQSRPFGLGANHSYGQFLTGEEPLTSVDLNLEDGGRVHYRPMLEAGRWVLVHDATPSRFLNSHLTWKGSDWLLELSNGSSYRFPSCDPAAKKVCTVSGYKDPNGREIRMTFDARGNLAKLESEHRHTIEFIYDDHDRVVLGWDDSGRWSTYAYDAPGRLIKTEYSVGVTKEYAYDDHDRLVRYTDGAVTESMAYDGQGRCSQFERQRLVYTDAAGHRFERLERFAMAYGATAANTIVREVIVSGTDGKRSITFDARGYALVDSYGAATATEQRTKFERDGSTDAVRHVSVTCQVAGRAASAAEDITPGANEISIVERVRRACDITAAKSER